MRIAIAQINQTLGDIQGNVSRITDYIKKAKQKKCDMIVFPELAITGYCPLGLAVHPDFINHSYDAAEEVSRQCRGITAVAGFLEPCCPYNESAPFNTAAVLSEGKVGLCSRKSVMGTVGIVSEKLFFSEGRPMPPMDILGKKTKIIVGMEDFNSTSWKGETHLIIAVCSFNFTSGRFGSVCARARKIVEEHAAPLVMVNHTGGRDELVFEGRSFVMDPDGKILMQAEAWKEDEIEWDTEASYSGISEADIDESGEFRHAVTTGIRDFVHKCGFEKVVIGISGGIDSAVTAAMAVRALGAENVLGVALPSRYSSDGSLEDARALAGNLGIELKTISIEAGFSAVMDSLEPEFRGLEEDVTEENVQPRIRGVILMALSNKLGLMLLATGNRSEISVGYMTIYGDTCGAFAPIADLNKGQVYALARRINIEKEIIPESIIKKAPSAELRPGQKDQDSLPAYDVLDPILTRLEENGMSPAALKADGLDPDVAREVIRMNYASAHKRRQIPPALKLVDRSMLSHPAFMPIAHVFRK